MHRLDKKEFYYAPTIMSDVTTKMPVMTEEVFGQVAAMIIVKDADEAIATANATEFFRIARIRRTSQTDIR